MRFCWDPKKAKANLEKHGVSFSDVEEVFVDDFALSREDPDAVDENRFVIVGLDSLGRTVTVVYTYTADEIRIISARKASTRERRLYERRIRFQ